jgi:hypothetical protein
VIEEIKKAWGWAGVDPAAIVATNAFGNIIFRDAAGRFWRMCPEDVYCEVIAESQTEYDALLGDEEFLVDWEMVLLVQAAYRAVGPLKPGHRYCLKMPGALGGDYVESNIGTVPWSELIAFSGHLAKEIEDLPDGTPIQIEIVGKPEC